MRKPVNAKWDEDGMKRSSQYGNLYCVAAGKMKISELEYLGIDEDDKKYIKQWQDIIAKNEKKGIVTQFYLPME